jgi:hypothetical protein
LKNFAEFLPYEKRTSICLEVLGFFWDFWDFLRVTTPCKNLILKKSTQNLSIDKTLSKI